MVRFINLVFEWIRIRIIECWNIWCEEENCESGNFVILFRISQITFLFLFCVFFVIFWSYLSSRLRTIDFLILLRIKLWFFTIVCCYFWSRVPVYSMCKILWRIPTQNLNEHYQQSSVCSFSFPFSHHTQKCSWFQWVK